MTPIELLANCEHSAHDCAMLLTPETYAFGMCDRDRLLSANVTVEYEFYVFAQGDSDLDDSTLVCSLLVNLVKELTDSI